MHLQLLQKPVYELIASRPTAWQLRLVPCFQQSDAGTLSLNQLGKHKPGRPRFHLFYRFPDLVFVAAKSEEAGPVISAVADIVGIQRV